MKTPIHHPSDEFFSADDVGLIERIQSISFDDLMIEAHESAERLIAKIDDTNGWLTSKEAVLYILTHDQETLASVPANLILGWAGDGADALLVFEGDLEGEPVFTFNHPAPFLQSDQFRFQRWSIDAKNDEEREARYDWD